MTEKRRWQWLGVTGLGLALMGSGGCQTYIPGMSLTLPSGRYLEHPPQYVRPDDDFPLSRELASQEANNAAALAGAVVPGAIGPAPQGVVPGVPAPNIPNLAPGVPIPAGPAPAPGPGGMPGQAR